MAKVKKEAPHLSRGMLIGIGLMSLAAKDAQKRVRKLMRDGDISRKQGEKLLSDVRAFSHKKESEIERIALAEARKQVAIVRKESKKHLSTLRKTLERLEKEL